MGGVAPSPAPNLPISTGSSSLMFSTLLAIHFFVQVHGLSHSIDCGVTASPVCYTTPRALLALTLTPPSQMAARPQCSVVTAATGKTGDKLAAMPAVFRAPIRPDVVQFVHMNMAKNKRQAYAIYKDTGVFFGSVLLL